MAAIAYLRYPQHRSPWCLDVAAPTSLGVVVSTKARRPHPNARLYRRRRVGAALAVTVLVICAGVMTRGGAGLVIGEADARHEQHRQVVHVVQPGDTLWAIARELQPIGDVRPLVARLAAARNGRPLEVGQGVSLP